MRPSKELQAKWEQILRNEGLGMDRGLRLSRDSRSATNLVYVDPTELDGIPAPAEGSAEVQSLPTKRSRNRAGNFREVEH